RERRGQFLATRAALLALGARRLLATRLEQPPPQHRAEPGAFQRTEIAPALDRRDPRVLREIVGGGWIEHELARKGANPARPGSEGGEVGHVGHGSTRMD